MKGLVVAEAFAMPVVLLTAKEDNKSVTPILIMSAILGILVGISTAKFAI